MTAVLFAVVFVQSRDNVQLALPELLIFAKDDFLVCFFAVSFGHLREATSSRFINVMESESG